MIFKAKKAVALALASVLTVGMTPASVIGAAEPVVSVKEAVISVSETQIQESGFARAVQSALNTAGEEASASAPYKVVLDSSAKGKSYALDSCLCIKSNTTLDMTGTTITSNTTNMLRADTEDNSGTTAKGGYSDFANIAVTGGLWIDNPTATDTRTSVMMRFGHITGLKLSNVSMKNCRGAHFLEIGAAKDVTVSGCSFSNESGAKIYEDSVVELDSTISESTFPHSSPYDGTSCENVTIKYCKFSHTACAINSPHYTKKFSNITASDNIISDTNEAAIDVEGWENSKVTGNSIDKAVHGGIRLLKAASSVNVTDNTVKNISEEAGRTPTGMGIQLIEATGGSITGNTVSNTASYGIHIGNGCTATKISGNKVSGVANGDGIRTNESSSVPTISSNTVSNIEGGDGISVGQASVKTVTGNKVSNIKGSEKGRGIYASKGKNTMSVTKNTVKSTQNAGIYFYTMKFSNLSNNTVSSTGGEGYHISACNITTMSGNKVSSWKGTGFGIMGKSVVKEMKNNDCGKKASGMKISGGCKAVQFYLASDSVKKGKSKTLKIYRPSSPKTTFTSSKKKVATVNKDGKVKGKKKGTVTITAKCGGSKCTIKVKVK